MKRYSLALSLFYLFALTSCGDGDTKSNTNTSAKKKIYTQSELAHLITPGLGLTELTNTFGPPGSTVEITTNHIMFIYMFPLEVKKPAAGSYLTGFSVDLENGHVVTWSPITSMVNSASPAGGDQEALGGQIIEFFIASEELSNVLATFEQNGVATIDHNQISPNLTIQAKVFSSSSAQQIGEKTVRLEIINNDDISKLKKLTENNLGKHLFIVSHKTVLAAPAISEPLTSSQLLFSVKNARTLEILKQ